MSMPFQPQPCEGVEIPEPPTPCCSPAIASAGLCLSDGTPIAVLAVSPCVECGAAATAPAVSGWLNLTTGAYTPGNPPAGVEACSGDPQQFQVGQWCDLDAEGEVIAPVLVEYEYDDDGQLIGVRTVTPGGDPYVVVGTLGLCPQAVGDAEYKVLCDRLGDGTTVQFLRAYTPNGDGTSSYDDTDLEGAPYTVQGTAEACGGCVPQLVERCGCDDADNDGLGEVGYVELWSVDPCGDAAPTLVGTWIDGDFEQPYTPVNPVDCIGDDTPDGGDEVTLFAQHLNVTPGAPWTPAAVTVGRTLTAVTYTVITGTATVADSNGTAVSAIPAGFSATWGNDRERAVTPPSSIAADVGGRVIVHWTEA